MRLSSITFVLLVTACGSSKPKTESPPPPTPTEQPAKPEAVTLDRDYPQLATRATQLYREVASVFDVAGENCPAATEKLAALQKAYADVVAANAKVLRDGRARELRAALVAHEQELDASAQSIVKSKTMATCSQDRAFTTAFDDLVGAPP